MNIFDNTGKEIITVQFKVVNQVLSFFGNPDSEVPEILLARKNNGLFDAGQENTDQEEQPGGNQTSMATILSSQQNRLEYHQAEISDHIHQAFAIGFTWVKANLMELIDAGWTRPELFRRSHVRWPVGNWGLAWLPVWMEQNIKATVNRRGQVCFIFSKYNRINMQTASPLRLLSNGEDLCKITG